MSEKSKPTISERIASEIMDTIERERRINKDDLIGAVDKVLHGASASILQMTADAMALTSYPGTTYSRGAHPLSEVASSDPLGAVTCDVCATIRAPSDVKKTLGGASVCSACEAAEEWITYVPGAMTFTLTSVADPRRQRICPMTTDGKHVFNVHDVCGCGATACGAAV